MLKKEYINRRIYFLLVMTMLAIGLLYLCRGFIGRKQEIKKHDLALNKFGVWLWYLHKTGYENHEDLAYTLANMGVKRIFVKVADGRDLARWSELRKRDVPKAYKKVKIEPWAWSYNYPGNETLQAEALYYAAKNGYKSFIIDIEKEFDNKPDAALKLFSAFYEARRKAMAQGYCDTTFMIYCTTWGNPRDHKTPLPSIDPFVDGYMPQTYVETWGRAHLNNIPYWIQSGTREYKELGATKPIHHVCSTELDLIDPREINEFLLHAGSNASVWRIPGGGIPNAVWQDWEKINWDLNTDTLPMEADQVVLMDSLHQHFALAYKGGFYTMKIKDTTGFVVKELPYNKNNLYKAPDLCKEKYYVEIYHQIRKTIHELDLRY